MRSCEIHQGRRKEEGGVINYLREGFHARGNKNLTTELDCAYTQQPITPRDLKNDEMSRMEVIGVIQKITKASFERADKHWYYCRRV